jgi:hypothetical protein
MGLVYHSLLPQDVPLMAHSVCLGLFFWRSSDAPTTAPGHTTYTHNPHSAISDEETHMHFARKMFNVVCTGTGSTMNRGGDFSGEAGRVRGTHQELREGSPYRAKGCLQLFR